MPHVVVSEHEIVFARAKCAVRANALHARVREVRRASRDAITHEMAKRGAVYRFVISSVLQGSSQQRTKLVSVCALNPSDG